ncbi:hypothetical protein OGAPHI_000452 [Ogataea philodendri]|uniref:Autophagy-related protein 2 n=1 Tax=Ogataea philodendri TaxID=1378263 RepID=A0A9P8PGR8_9ASCO|nr:uncharacterized protein OGAPHI_000452 [Ogataea philodendri]KAH3671747.1 hypothetical protein OGAPHI_000452 [Ogataea philodendri]
MPQNIQKRLLRYVLQQLSLFSEIDLPNLEVSLGTSSNINLRNLELDIDKFNVPGIYMRNGSIEQLSLSLTMSDGVNIDCTGIKLSLSPSVTGDKPSNSEQFSLAKSTADLANSMMFDDNVIDEDEKIDISTPEDHDNKPKDTKEYRMSNMVARAADMALAKLQVTVRDITITMISDSSVMEARIDKISFLTKDGTRYITVEGLQINCVKPSVYPGEGLDLESEENESPTETDDSDYDDYDDQMMQTSFMADNRDDIQKSLMESMMFNSNNASSVYMSATSHYLSAEQSKIDPPKPPQSVRIVNVDRMEMHFEGLQNIENIEVKIGVIKVAAAPIPECISSLLQSIKNLAKLSMVKPENEQKPEETQEPVTPTLINSFSIESIIVSLTSALTTNGEFAEQNSLRLVLDELNYEQKSPKFSLGTITKIKVIRQEDESLFHFDESRTSSVADLGFEVLNNDVQRTTVLCPKSANFTLDSQLVTTASRYYKLVIPLLEKLQSTSHPAHAYSLSRQARLSSRQVPPTVNDSELSVQTSSIHINLKFPDHSMLKATVLPVSYHSSSGKFETERVLLELVNSLQKDSYASSEYLLISGISSVTQSVDKVRFFDANSHQESWLPTKVKVKLESITSKFELPSLQQLVENINILSDLVTETINLPKTASRPKRVRMGNSLFMSNVKTITNSIEIGSITGTLSNIREGFGDMNGSLKDIMVNSLQDGSIHSSIMNVSIVRTHGELVEPFIVAANAEDKSLPMLFAKFKSSFDVHFRNCAFNYYGRWLILFDSVSKPSTSLTPDHNTSSADKGSKVKLEIHFTFSNLTIALVPVNLNSKIEVAIKKGIADLFVGADGNTRLQSSFSSISLFLIDDVANIRSDQESKAYRHWVDSTANRATWTLNSFFKSKGYVSVGSSATLFLNINFSTEESLEKTVETKPASKALIPLVDMKIHLDSLNVDLCADSSQCFLQTLKDLKQPVQFTFDEKYKPRTQEVDIFKDIDENCYQDEVLPGPEEPYSFEAIDDGKLEIVEDFYDKNALDDSGSVSGGRSTTLNKSATKSGQASNIYFEDDHFDRLGNDEKANRIIPMAISVSVSNVRIKLFDGYDWKETQTTIKNAIKRVEDKAREIPQPVEEDIGDLPESISPQNPDDLDEIEAESVSEMLYESIHVGLLAGQDPQTFYDNINKSINNRADIDSLNDRNTLSPSPSSTSSTNFNTSSRSATPAHNIDLGKTSNHRLRLKRSSYHKILVELDNVDVSILMLVNSDPNPSEDPVLFSENESTDDSEILSRIDVTVGSLNIIDNVPTSSWKMFAGYLREAGDKEVGASMLHLSIDTVRPVSSLAASEIVLSVNVLPLRLYVDQDTLDFLTRFGEFKDDRFVPPALDDEDIFIQKFKVNSVKVKLDYKPKKVDYAGIRSGHTAEFVNFFILDESEMILKKLVLYGVPGFPRLHKLLNDSWMPDIKRNQLGGVLSGLAPVKSIVKIGSGFRELFAVPIREYQKDGRVVRGVQQGAVSFAKITGGELLKFGVKLAAGTQTILESTEEALGGDGSSTRLPDYKKNRKNGRRRSSNEVVYAIAGDNSLAGHSSLNTVAYHRGSFDSYGDEEELLDEDPVLDQGSLQDDQQIQKTKFIIPSSFRSTGELNNVLESDSDLDDEYTWDSESESQKIVSLYSNQPENLNEGLQTAYTSFGKNLDTARRAIVSAGTRAARSGSAQVAAKEFAKATPIMMIRPIIGTTEAISRALQGGINVLDPEEKKRSEEKYKNTGAKPDEESRNV